MSKIQVFVIRLKNGMDSEGNQKVKDAGLSNMCDPKDDCHFLKMKMR